MHTSDDSPEPEDILWEKINPNLDTLLPIIANHFGSPCKSQEPLQRGTYARAFLYILQDGPHVVARVILPTRRTLKTEAEVAAMEAIRGMQAVLAVLAILAFSDPWFPSTYSIPVPCVHLYCSMPDNPVRVEWVLMDYIPGRRLVDCWDDMGIPQKTTMAEDLAGVVAEMFALTASHCGSLLCDLSLDNSKRSLRYEPSAADTSVVVASDETYTTVVNGDFLISPINDLTFLTLTEPVPSSLCGPFAAERAFLEAFGYRDECGGTKVLSRFDRWPVERMFEIYDVIRPLYVPPVDSSAPFHFVHADLSGANLIVDPELGRIAGMINWEDGWLPTCKALCDIRNMVQRRYVPV